MERSRSGGTLGEAEDAPRGSDREGQPIKRVCVYCGSKDGDSPRFLEAAAEFGRALAAHGLDLVYGGAQNGLMGALASAVLEGGRHVIGVVPRGLSHQEFAHPDLSEHVLVEGMSERKALMAEKGDAYVALPGGFGTMDELFDMLCGAQLGLHRKPIGLLNLDGYYQPLLDWIALAVQRGFIPGALKDVLLVRSDPNELVRALLTHPQPAHPALWNARQG
jgi:hypothetical protein